MEIGMVIARRSCRYRERVGTMVSVQKNARKGLEEAQHLPFEWQLYKDNLIQEVRSITPCLSLFHHFIDTHLIISINAVRHPLCMHQLLACFEMLPPPKYVREISSSLEDTDRLAANKGGFTGDADLVIGSSADCQYLDLRPAFRDAVFSLLTRSCCSSNTLSSSSGTISGAGVRFLSRCRRMRLLLI